MKEKNLNYLTSLIKELRSLPGETEWVEFKVNNSKPDEIGEYISAISNSSALSGKTCGYIVWGIDNDSHDIVGTKFNPSDAKKGNEELESWLLRLLSPKIHFSFYSLEINGKTVSLCEIQRANKTPVQFSGIEFIRVGSYKKKLKEFPEIERQLWRIFDETPFEQLIVVTKDPNEDVLLYLDYPAYFDLMHLPLPDNRSGILERLEDDSIIQKSDSGKFEITNMGALLFAKDIKKFQSLKRKAVRVIVYKDRNRFETVKEQEGSKGYGAGFEGLIDYVNNLLPMNEVIGKALRKNIVMYPELSLRELIANALIHQDFAITGTGPMIEIFSDRIEITNPGIPLVKTERFIDSPPKSRNEDLASLMRRAGICEERGSGIDKVIINCEVFQLPAPIFEIIEDHTKVTLFSHKKYSKMDKKDRIRACYQHASLKYVQKDYMTNASLRERFGIDSKNSSMISRLIKDALQDGVIKAADPGNESRKHAKYMPYWA